MTLSSAFYLGVGVDRTSLRDAARTTWFDCGSIERSRDAHQPLSDHRRHRSDSEDE
ncbi:hypothetical protein [Nostoc sp.]|uniref:hypothetical protein n=1 Tax=Nostoc sp. TaxID=1180 RepID=UPI002FF777B3